MPSARQTFRPECDPARVGAAINGLYAERRARPRLPITGGTDFEALASEAEWTAGWWEQLREQHRRSGEWARYTGQPYSIRQAIDDAERHALRKSLAARGRAGHWQRCAASVAMSAAIGNAA